MVHTHFTKEFGSLHFRQHHRRQPTTMRIIVARIIIALMASIAKRPNYYGQMIPSSNPSSMNMIRNRHRIVGMMIYQCHENLTTNHPMLNRDY